MSEEHECMYCGGATDQTCCEGCYEDVQADLENARENRITCELEECAHNYRGESCECSPITEHTDQFDNEGFPIFRCRGYLKKVKQPT